MILHFCLFVWGLSSHSRNFHSYGEVNITDGGLQILTYAWHSWAVRSEDSLAWHTYCGTGHLFILVIFENPWDSQLLSSVWQWIFDFCDLGMSRHGFQHPTFRLRGERFNPLRHGRGRYDRIGFTHESVGLIFDRKRIAW